MTPIYYQTGTETDCGDETRVEVSPDRQAVWLPADLDETSVGEWTRKEVARYEDDLDGDGYPTPEMVAACRADRALTAAAAGRKSVDLDVSAVVADVAWQLRADARAERRHGHPSLTAGERG